MAGFSGVFCSGSSETGLSCPGFGDLGGPNRSAADSRAALRTESGHSFAPGPRDGLSMGSDMSPVSRAGPFPGGRFPRLLRAKGRCRRQPGVVWGRSWAGRPIPGGEVRKSSGGWSPAGRRAAAPCARTSGGRGRSGVVEQSSGRAPSLLLRDRPAVLAAVATKHTGQQMGQAR